MDCCLLGLVITISERTHLAWLICLNLCYAFFLNIGDSTALLNYWFSNSVALCYVITIALQALAVTTSPAVWYIKQLHTVCLTSKGS